jgi:hypothetical protein
MTAGFTRALGAEPGVQLNPLRDNSEIPALNNQDQVFAIAARLTRGRIDKPFVADRGNVKMRTGHGESLSKSSLNEAWICLVEALNNGAYQAVIHRLHTESAVVKWAVLALSQDGAAINFSVSANEPTGDFLLAVKHLECFNDGIKLELRADESKVGGVAQPNNVVALRLRDSNGALLKEFVGSLDPEALDDYRNSFYLPNVVSTRTDTLELLAGTSHAIPPNCEAYGYDANGREAWAKSAVLACFDEGGTAYAVADYMKARERLQFSKDSYAYIAAAGTRSPGLLAQLAQLAYDTNRQLRYDIPGELYPEAAIAFAEQMNFGESITAHLIHGYWSPLKIDDPTGINGKAWIGRSTLNIAYACQRNAQVNAKGFAPKNYPIAGRGYPLNNSGVKQTYYLTGQESNALAKAKINPVIYESFPGGGGYVFFDSITSAQVESSQRKLIAVAEMSTSIDEYVVLVGNMAKQLPMKEAIRRAIRFIKAHFEGAVASGWIVPSSDPSMDGNGWKLEVMPDEARPFDRMVINYWIRYDGTARQIFVTQTLATA